MTTKPNLVLFNNIKFIHFFNHRKKTLNFSQELFLEFNGVKLLHFFFFEMQLTLR